jgi:hypothetical protein
VSDRITKDSARRSDALFKEIRALLEESLADHVAKDLPPAYVRAILDALAETTLGVMAAHPKDREQHKRAGFDVFWKGIAR